MSTKHCATETSERQIPTSQPNAAQLREHLKVLLGRIWLYNLTHQPESTDSTAHHEGLLLAIIRIQPEASREQLSLYLNLSILVVDHLIQHLLASLRINGHDAQDPTSALHALSTHTATMPEPQYWEAWLWEFLDSATLPTLEELQGSFLKTLRTMHPHIPTPTMCITCAQFSAFHYPSDLIRPHHCQLLNQPLLDVDLRLDCREHRLRIVP